MRTRIRNNLRRTLVFVSVLALIASSALVTGYAEDKVKQEAAAEVTEVSPSNNEPTIHVDNHSRQMPALTGSKMKLSDPHFSSKEWYEYVEYEDQYTEVKDGSVTYRIHKPKSYSQASIMAIGDYNPDTVTGNKTNLSRSLSKDLEGVLEIAAQGGNISKDYVALDLTTGIATHMSSIDEVIDNSKYYSSSSFLGIPGANRYGGVSNDGFFNASSLEITITKSETVSVGKTVALDSRYTVLEGYTESKDYSKYSEYMHSDGRQHTDSSTSGWAISDTATESKEISKAISDAIGQDIVREASHSATIGYKNGGSNSFSSKHTETHKEGYSLESDVETNLTDDMLNYDSWEDFTDDPIGYIVGSSLGGGIGSSIIPFLSDQLGIDGIDVFGFGVDASHDKQTEYSEDITTDETEFGHTSYQEFQHSNTASNSISIGNSHVNTVETGESYAVSSSNSVTKNVENGKQDTSSIENALTNGENVTDGKQNQKQMAVDVGYGVDYQVGNQVQNSIAVKRTFKAREDSGVKDVGWKLCEYVVKVPYYIEVVKNDGTPLYAQYVNYNLLNGVCRVFANGYIEHWYTGNLVTYADFFDGFVTVDELVDIAKEQRYDPLPKEGE